MGFSHFVNPLSCAVGHAVLQEILECDLTDNAADRGEELKKPSRSAESSMRVYWRSKE